MAIENADHAVLRGNRLLDDEASQLLVIQTSYSSEANCFHTGRPGELVAEFFPYFATDRYRTLAAYQNAKREDLHSREGGCDPTPAKIDVRSVHAATVAYAGRARETLSRVGNRGGTARGWFDWLLGR